MSGKRQHVIPQFLQRGFSSHKNGEESFIYVFRRDKAPFNSNIRRSGAEGYFYTEGDDTSVDDAITEYESDHLSGLIERLRSNGSDEITSAELALVISHFEVRSRHLRQGFLATGEKLFSELIDRFADREWSMNYFQEYLSRNPGILRSSFEGELVKRGLSIELIEKRIGSIDATFPQAIAETIPMVCKTLRELRENIPEQLKASVNKAHLDALNMSLHPEQRAELYLDLSYEIVDIDSSDMILGDSVVLFEVSGEERLYCPFTDKSKKVVSVFLPLSSSRLLVGYRGDRLPKIDIQSLKEVIARCSLEYFLAPVNSEENQRLQALLGLDAMPFSDKEFDVLMSQILENLLSQKTDM